MTTPRASTFARRFGFDSALDALIYALSVYGVPVVIAAATLFAFAAWERSHENVTGEPLALAVVADPGARLDLARALEQLRVAPPERHRDTRLAETPFWFAFTAQAPGGEVELPSRHALELACWDAGSLQRLGQADRAASSGALQPAKAGFLLRLGERETAARVVCRGVFAGPARISALQWQHDPFAASVTEFHRNAGLLEGGLLVLSAFVLVAALINREWLYVLFAAWLFASLRMATISAGWDTQWVGHTIPPAAIFAARKVTIALYYVLTYALFARLFGEDLRRVGTGWPLALARWSCVVVLLAAAVLPFAQFLPVIWGATSVGVSVIAFYLVRILRVTRSMVAMWYASALGVSVFAGMYEVVAAALGVKELIGALNSMTAALSSSLLAAFAIAEQMRAEHVERVRAETDLKSAYDAIPIGVFTLARDGSFERFNPALAGMLRFAAADGRRRYWRDHFGAESWNWLVDRLLEGRSDEREIHGVGGGAARWFHVKIAPAGDKIEGSLQDITARREATDRLQFLAENDPLTGVLNRRGIEKILEAATQQAAENLPVAVAYMDLDRFKLINELFGHVAGDEVLRQVCRRAEKELGQAGAMGRIGGDEFVIVFRDVAIGVAAATCRRIVEAIGATPFQTGDKAFQVKTSIGLVEVADRLPVRDAIAVADRACRAAKTGAHEGLVVNDRGASAFRDWARERAVVERLGTGTAPEGLFLAMQPILAVRAPFTSLNFEVLVRMREADGSVTPGGLLVATAENNGRASVIDRWVMSNTLGWLDRHHARLAATHFVSMNLSGASLNDERFVHDAFAMLAEAPRAAQRLCLEITEGVALHDLDNTRRFIDRVRSYGAKVALDDFGAGYTSFSYLRELPADALKIDGSLIVNVNAHPANLAIVETIVELARNLGMRSVAEWAEDQATLATLAEIGIDYVQGFVVAQAQDPAALLAAQSSASFIMDAEVLRYVRDTLAPAAESGAPLLAARRERPTLKLL